MFNDAIRVAEGFFKAIECSEPDIATSTVSIRVSSFSDCLIKITSDFCERYYKCKQINYKML